MTAPRPRVLLPLYGTACAVCTRPARYVDDRCHVVHVARAKRPCPLPTSLAQGVTR